MWVKSQTKVYILGYLFDTDLEVEDYYEEVENMMVEREKKKQAADASTSVKAVKSSNIKDLPEQQNVTKVTLERKQVGESMVHTISGLIAKMANNKCNSLSTSPRKSEVA
jgi:hypothetical protein